MINPIPKNPLFATLNANEIAALIEGLPSKYRMDGYLIYFGAVNMCSAHVDATIEAHYHRDCGEYPAVESADPM